MAHIRITRHHTLGRERAHQAAEAVAEELRAHYKARTSWDGDVLRVQGPGVKGALTATADTIHIEAKLGLPLRPFRRSLETEIRERLDAAVGPQAAR